MQPFLADTWSLGCNFYILLCGHSAFWPYEDNDAALFKARSPLPPYKYPGESLRPLSHPAICPIPLRPGVPSAAPGTRGTPCEPNHHLACSREPEADPHRLVRPQAIKGGVVDWSALDKLAGVTAAAKASPPTSARCYTIIRSTPLNLVLPRAPTVCATGGTALELDASRRAEHRRVVPQGIVRMMLVNDPAQRAKIDQLALHPWVTGAWPCHPPPAVTLRAAPLVADATTCGVARVQLARCCSWLRAPRRLTAAECLANALPLTPWIADVDGALAQASWRHPRGRCPRRWRPCASSWPAGAGSALVRVAAFHHACFQSYVLIFTGGCPPVCSPRPGVYSCWAGREAEVASCCDMVAGKAIAAVGRFAAVAGLAGKS